MTCGIRLSLAAALLVAFGTFTVQAQDTDPPADPPADAAPADTAPATDTPAADAPETDAQSTDGTAADSDLPPVEVIQEQPKPKPQPKPQPAATQPDPEPAPPPQQVAQPVPPPADFEPDTTVEAPVSAAVGRARGDLVPVAPFGAEIPIEKVPSSVSTVNADAISDNRVPEPQETLQKEVPGVILTDSAGSSFRSQLEYRGYGAGSVTGFPQGLAVYQNGVRINEVFGDVVNWDLIPSNAISDITIVNGNPVYGLNAIGGGVSILMKDGFNYQGAEIDVMAGAHGRKQVSIQAGMQSGPWAVYVAGQKIKEDGFRDFSPADVERLYGDLGVKGSKVEAHFNVTWADSSAGVVTAAPDQLLNIDWSRTFTSPQITGLEVVMPSINAKVEVTDTLTLAGLAYYRRYKSDVIDGNLLEGAECQEVADANGIANPFGDALCSEEVEDGELEPLRDASGNIIEADDVGEEPFGVIDNITQKAESYGGTIQAVEKSKIFGLGNQFLLGASYDRGNVRYQTASEPGTIGPFFVVTGSGIILSEPDDFTPRNVDVDTEYFGVYFSNTLDVTDELAITFGGRYNHAEINLVDLTGEFEGITSNHTFERFNPNVGATYQVFPGITVYGSYAESNRAPTPAELACANPENPCPIESFLTDDPPLSQVLTNTWEAGIRGRYTSADGGQKVSWGLGWFRAENQDDILFVSSQVTGRGFFFNAGDTLRQGLEAKLRYENGPLAFYAGYTYLHATFETPNEFQSPNHPLAGPCSAPEVDEPICINVRPGDSIPGIPEHRVKAGISYWITEKWKVGADLIAASGQYHLGDEINALPLVGGYTRVDLKTSYDLNENVQLYAFVNNIFDRRYGLFGTLFDTEESSEALVGPDALIIGEFSNPRSIVPAAPISAYGGVKVKF